MLLLTYTKYALRPYVRYIAKKNRVRKKPLALMALY